MNSRLGGLDRAAATVPTLGMAAASAQVQRFPTISHPSEHVGIASFLWRLFPPWQPVRPHLCFIARGPFL